MQIVNMIQGSPEWHAHRLQHFNASDAPAMMGCSPYKTRSQLIKEVATGLTEEVDAQTQRLYDDGHRTEALTRPIAEEIIGEELYPLVGTNGPLSASFDGLTFLYDKGFECKRLNKRLREAMVPGCTGADLPMDYQVQMEHQHAVNEACEETLFVAAQFDDAGNLVEERHCWYRPNLELRAQIVAGWKQFEADVAAYAPPEIVEPIEVVGHQPDQLPALRSTVRGELVLESNIVEWEAAALAYIKGVREHELKTDEDFANADAAAEWCDTSKTTLMGVRANLMSATGDVNTAVATIDRIVAALDKTRTTFAKAIKERKDARKLELVHAKQTELRGHLDTLTKRVGVPVVAAADFQGVLKNLKSFASMESKLSTELARVKIAASQLADLIDGNRRAMDAADAAHLFPDFSTVCTKPADDFANLVTSRRQVAQERADKERKDREAAAAKAKADADEKAEADRLAALNTPLQGSQQVLKAEASTPDATDRVASAYASPVGGPTGAGQPAAAGPIGGAAPAPEVRAFRRAVAPAVAEEATLSLGRISGALGFTVDAKLMARLGFTAQVVKAARLYRPSEFPAIKRALIEHIEATPDEVPLAA
jgi:putative phage-type endonuclease